MQDHRLFLNTRHPTLWNTSLPSTHSFISFVSKGWCGHTSQKHITENCFLDNPLPGDIVSADRGFNIRESVGMMCAAVKIPARVRAQLDAKDDEETGAIVQLKICVERVIGVVGNKYRILHTVAPLFSYNLLWKFWDYQACSYLLSPFLLIYKLE